MNRWPGTLYITAAYFTRQLQTPILNANVIEQHISRLYEINIVGVHWHDRPISVVAKNNYINSTLVRSYTPKVLRLR